MARPLRIEFPDAIYHVTSRGTERRRIVRDGLDHDKWLDYLGRTVGLHHWRLFAFALMDNHFHLFVQTPEANLSAGMRMLNGSHAGTFNRRHGRVGPLFQGRYKAVLIEGEGHWLAVSRYIHLNPVRARLSLRPEGWRWSSYRGYASLRSRLPWVTYGRALSEFGGDNREGRRAYRAFVEAGIGKRLESPLGEAVHRFILGSEGFIARVLSRVKGPRRDEESPALKQLARRVALDKVLRVTAEYFGCDRGRWLPGRRSDDLVRAVAAHVARKVSGARSRPEYRVRFE